MQLCSDDVQNVFKINHHYLISWDLDDWKNVLTASQTDNSSFMEADHQIKERKCPLLTMNLHLSLLNFINRAVFTLQFLLAWHISLFEFLAASNRSGLSQGLNCTVSVRLHDAVKEEPTALPVVAASTRNFVVRY